MTAPMTISRPPAAAALAALGGLLLLVAPVGCGQEANAEREDQMSQEERLAERYGPPGGDTREVEEPLSFTTEPYGFQGPDDISEVLALFPGDAVWYGVAPGTPYPVQGNCTPGSSFDNRVEAEPGLPKTIEGVVTLHPRFYTYVTVCDQRERNYGAYILEDDTGGILVLKDSRIADFSYGDRVRLKVSGLVKFFDTYAVLVHDEQQIVGHHEALHFEHVTGSFQAEGPLGSMNNHIGKVVRIEGEVIREPTNNNFNEAILRSLTDPNVEWIVSLDKELGLRGHGFRAGEKLQLTGPVVNSFGLRMLIARLGQIEHLDSGGAQQ